MNKLTIWKITYNRENKELLIWEETDASRIIDINSPICSEIKENYSLLHLYYNVNEKDYSLILNLWKKNGAYLTNNELEILLPKSSRKIKEDLNYLTNTLSLNDNVVISFFKENSEDKQYIAMVYEAFCEYFREKDKEHDKLLNRYRFFADTYNR